MRCGIWRSISTYRVALSCAVINLLHLGMLRIVGLQVVASTHRYNVNREQASFPYILRMIVNQISGPFVGYLGCKLGIEQVTVLGCILSSLSIGGCFFAESIIVVTICWGVCFGISAAMAGQLLPTFLPLHFKENLSKANGVAVAGSALGAVLYSPLYEYMLEMYGISGSFLIVSAMCLNTLPAAMFLVYSQRQLESSKKRTCADSVKFSNEHQVLRCAKFSNEKGICSDPPKMNSCKTIELDEDNLKLDGNTVITNYERNKDQLGVIKIVNDKESAKHTSMLKISYDIADSDKMYYENRNFNKNCKEKSLSTNLDVGCMLHSGVLQPNSNEIDVSMNKSTDDRHGKPFSSIKKDNKACCKLSPGDTSQPSTKPLEVPKSQAIPRRKLNFDVFTLFYDPLFLVLTFTQSSFMAILQILSATIVDFALDKGIPTNLSVYALMLSSIADLLARLFLGSVTDAGCMSASSFSALCYFCVGMGFAGMSLSWEFFGLLASVCFAAVFVGGQMLISPVLVSRYFDGERRTMAMTTRYVLAVPFYFAVSPLIGFFRDRLGSYDGLFYSVSAFAVASSILLIFLPSIAKLGKYRRNDQIID